MRIFHYLCFEIKTAYKCILGTFIGFITIIGLLLSLLYAINIAKASTEEALAINVGVVLPEDQSELGGLFRFANNLTSLKGYCNLISCSEEEVKAGLLNNEYSLAVIIPDDFFEKSIHMQPAEFTILLPHELSHNEKKLISMFHGVEHVMVVCESAIQSMYYSMYTNSFSFTRQQMENDFTSIYVKQFLSRNNIFDVDYLSSYGNYSFIEYYLSSIILISLIICSISFFGMYGNNELYLEKILSVSTSGIIRTTIIKILSQTIALSTMMLGLLLSLTVIDKIMALNIIFFEPNIIIGIILISLSVSSYTHLIITLCKCSADSSIYYILLSMIMVILCGGVVPKVYFPKALNTLSFALPFSSWHNALLSLLFENHLSGLISVLIINVILLFLGITLYVRQVRHNV